MTAFIKYYQFLPERDYVTFGYLHGNSSVICLLSVTFVHRTQPVEIFGNVSTPFCHPLTTGQNFTKVTEGTSPSAVKRKRYSQI